MCRGQVICINPSTCPNINSNASPLSSPYTQHLPPSSPLFAPPNPETPCAVRAHRRVPGRGYGYGHQSSRSGSSPAHPVEWGEGEYTGWDSSDGVASPQIDAH
jgi:hypothetical protein